MTGIYALFNFVTNKIYIGQAVIIYKRWKNHRIALDCNTHTNRYLQSAYNKDGQFAFIYYVLEECSVEELTIREQHWMDFYQSYNREFGYNLAPAADSNVGLKHSEETIEAWSKQRKGKKRSEEAKAAIKAGWVKRKANGPVSEETKRKSSESHKGQKKSEEFKEAARQRMTGNTYNKGRTQSIEHIEARRKANTGQKRTEAQRINIAIGITGRIVSEETKARMSASAKQRHRRKEKDLMWTW